MLTPDMIIYTASFINQTSRKLKVKNCFPKLTWVNARQRDAIYNKFYISENILTLMKFLSLLYGCAFWSDWRLKPAEPCPDSTRAE
jgi:hypothetical protein